ncbi:MAG: hypothetical protein KY469_04205 [Actinobacteria bacterium]|nr:hypothetical protein [Actinomycetota bacterium]
MIADRVALVGSAWTEISRDAGRGEGDLALDACLAAIRDAGLEPSDVDGIATYPGGMVASVSSTYVLQGLGMQNVRWYVDANGNGPAAMTAVIEAALAVAAGACETAVAFRAYARPRHHVAGGALPDVRMPPDITFKLPYGNAAATQWIAMWATRHMHDFGTRPEHLGRIAVSTRAWATTNPRAIARDPITLDDYLASPYISEPFRKLDCDFPVDAAVAVVLTTPERARDLPHRPVHLRNASVAPGPRPDWDQAPSYREMSAAYAARDLWSGAGGLTPDDVDVALLYDGFTFLTLSWLEALGFCALGEGGAFIEDVGIGPGGDLPVNTHGGNLSEGRTHGMGQIAEAVRQLQGRGADNQVADASVAVVSAGGGPLAGALLLHNQEPGA